ncbi:unnamed protein product, partial [Polarella glacialis]
VMAARQASAALCGGTNLIVLGDSASEMEAAQTSTVGLLTPWAVKTVKFKEAPSVDELLEQLRLINQELAAVVTDDKSCCRNLAHWMQPVYGGHQPSPDLVRYQLPGGRHATTTFNSTQLGVSPWASLAAASPAPYVFARE